MLMITFKDAISVSLYPYNRSQILQYVRYTKKLTLQKELQHFVTNNELLDKKLKHNNNKTKNQTYKPLPEPGIEMGTSCTQSRCVTTAPLNQLRV